MTHKAFTLAEVLITLVIIGIIAAISVPTLIASHQKHQTAIKLKKTYSELNQAMKLAEVRLGNRYTWEWTELTTSEFFDKYLYPFVQISNKKLSNTNIQYLKMNGDPETNFTAINHDADTRFLVSGVLLITKVHGMSSKLIGIDINGDNKPNKMGRDLFIFDITTEGVRPFIWNDNEVGIEVKRSRKELLDGPSEYSYNCSKNARGMWCAGVIMADGWEIKSDYPW